MTKKPLTRLQLAKYWRDVGYSVGKGEGYAAAIADVLKAISLMTDYYPKGVTEFATKAQENIKALLSRGSR